jgi:hypothetical protein
MFVSSDFSLVCTLATMQLRRSFEESAAQSNADVIAATTAGCIVEREMLAALPKFHSGRRSASAARDLRVGRGRPQIDTTEYQVSRVFLSWKTLKVGVGKPRHRSNKAGRIKTSRVRSR